MLCISTQLKRDKQPLLCNIAPCNGRTGPFPKVMWGPVEIVRNVKAIFLGVVNGVLQNWLEQQLKNV